ncbi:hypothetical protein SAMN02745866_00386 [Alteromonadaceae bacterium Bs31]|nr:hypothetical protein SAMN02745866_00386 [Alteromonadaceae bacterium Bs31]
MRFRFSVLLLLVFVLSEASAAPIDVPINKIRATNSPYMLDLMKLALSYSDRQYKFVETSERLSKAAQHEAALHGNIAVYWGGTSPDQEEEFIPVRIDGYRGLMSLRFMIVRASDIGRYRSVNNINDLRNFRMGQGRGWKDGKILESAGFDVEVATKKAGLFHMLDGGRFDAFPRGATEAWVETDANRDLNLAVEEHLVIRYLLPTYFFVNKGRKQFANDIEAGLLMAIEDGSFDRFFYGSDRVQRFLDQANLAQRKIIDLNNPFLSKAAIESAKFNFSVEDLIEGARRIKAGEFDVSSL